jgi:hypothetical protein
MRGKSASVEDIKTAIIMQNKAIKTVLLCSHTRMLIQTTADLRGSCGPSAPSSSSSLLRVVRSATHDPIKSSNPIVCFRSWQFSVFLTVPPLRVEPLSSPCALLDTWSHQAGRYLQEVFRQSSHESPTSLRCHMVAG